MKAKLVLSLLMTQLLLNPSAEAKKTSQSQTAISPQKRSLASKARATKPPVKVARRSLEFNARLSSEAREQIAKIEQQLRSVKTVGEWSDRAPRQAKLRRRLHFANLTKTPLPRFVSSGYSILFSFGDKKAKTHLFTLYPDRRGIVTLLNGVDISPRPKEAFEKWSQRLLGSTQAQAHPFKDFLLPWAHAQQGGAFNEFRFAQMLRLMSNDDWESFDLANVSSSPGVLVSEQEARSLAAEQDFLTQHHGLRCDRDGTARLSGQIAGRPVEMKAHPRRNPNDLSFTVDLESGGAPRGQLKVSGDGREASLTLPGRIFSHESLLPALQWSVQGGDLNKLPETSPARGPQPVHPSDLVGALEATRACKAIKAAGITACDEFLQDQVRLAACARDLVSAGLPGGFLNRSPLKSLSPDAALALKAQLLGIYQDADYQFPIGSNFPSERSRQGFPAPRFNGQHLLTGDQLLQALGQDLDESNPTHQILLACARSQGQSRDCTRPEMHALLGENVWGFEMAVGRVAGAHRAYDLNQHLAAAVSEPDACSQAFIDNNMLIAAEQYEKLEMVNSNESALVQTEAELSAAMAAIDAARAVCGNAQMRNQVQGTQNSVRSSN